MFNPFLALTFSELLANFIRGCFDSYVTPFGGLGYGIFFGIIGLFVYTQSKGSEALAIAIYMILLGIVFHYIFPYGIGILFGVIGIIALMIVFYTGFVSRGQDL